MLFSQPQVSAQSINHKYIKYPNKLLIIFENLFYSNNRIIFHFSSLFSKSHWFWLLIWIITKIPEHNNPWNSMFWVLLQIKKYLSSIEKHVTCIPDRFVKMWLSDWYKAFHSRIIITKSNDLWPNWIIIVQIWSHE